MKLLPPPDPPELPEAARPRWPPWYAPVALLTALGTILTAGLPVLPVILVAGVSEELAAISLLVLLIVQDGVLVGFALLFANFKRRPRLWHFGARATRFWPTAGWAALGFGLLLGIEVGYIEGLDVEETNVDDLGEGSPLAGVAVALATIVVAPVAEELFFRAFFYRALRSRLRVWSASLIDGLVFGALHFQGLSTVEILPVIALVGVGLCLVYERTGSLFAVIAIHAAFNTVATVGIAPVAALLIGALMLAACVLTPRRLGPAPSPFGLNPRAVPA
ncbi:MAG TPA: type II CAAX endopeptidase family protein [Thermoleophilaceae bacterium]|nr:type II CAAX endopeptidase family protein [Thermoleophilaceae bacterium]